jgi:capsule polysaccharide export protein KpsE/RkpR
MVNDREAIDQGAEFLVLYQLDLLAQVEQQVRSVHHMLRRIERLRSGKHRVGADLTNNQRTETLAALGDELNSLDVHLLLQHDVCRDMRDTINAMKARVESLRRHTAAQASQEQERDAG